MNVVLHQKRLHNIVVGFDTRDSSKSILNLINKNLKSLHKINIINKPISTPALQYISKKHKIFGIMITASHFHYRYNGFKFFLNGKKISRKFEKKITDKIYKKNNSNKISKTIKVRVKINPYINMLIKNLVLRIHSVCWLIAQMDQFLHYKKINFLKNTNIININFKK